ncbi:protein kinase, partial [Candidatus Margulisiibacteriota bacterium]
MLSPKITFTEITFTEKNMQILNTKIPLLCPTFIKMLGSKKHTPKELITEFFKFIYSSLKKKESRDINDTKKIFDSFKANISTLKLPKQATNFQKHNLSTLKTHLKKTTSLDFIIFIKKSKSLKKDQKKLDQFTSFQEKKQKQQLFSKVTEVNYFTGFSELGILTTIKIPKNKTQRKYNKKARFINRRLRTLGDPQFSRTEKEKDLKELNNKIIEIKTIFKLIKINKKKYPKEINANTQLLKDLVARLAFKPFKILLGQKNQIMGLITSKGLISLKEFNIKKGVNEKDLALFENKEENKMALEILTMPKAKQLKFNSKEMVYIDETISFNRDFETAVKGVKEKNIKGFTDVLTKMYINSLHSPQCFKQFTISIESLVHEFGIGVFQHAYNQDDGSSSIRTAAFTMAFDIISEKTYSNIYNKNKLITTDSITKKENIPVIKKRLCILNQVAIDIFNRLPQVTNIITKKIKSNKSKDLLKATIEWQMNNLKELKHTGNPKIFDLEFKKLKKYIKNMLKTIITNEYLTSEKNKEKIHTAHQLLLCLRDKSKRANLLSNPEFLQKVDALPKAIIQLVCLMIKLDVLYYGGYKNQNIKPVFTDQIEVHEKANDKKIYTDPEIPDSDINSYFNTCNKLIIETQLLKSLLDLPSIQQSNTYRNMVYELMKTQEAIFQQEKQLLIIDPSLKPLQEKYEKQKKDFLSLITKKRKKNTLTSEESKKLKANIKFYNNLSDKIREFKNVLKKTRLIIQKNRPDESGSNFYRNQQKLDFLKQKLIAMKKNIFKTLWKTILIIEEGKAKIDFSEILKVQSRTFNMRINQLNAPNIYDKSLHTKEAPMKGLQSTVKKTFPLIDKLQINPYYDFLKELLFKSPSRGTAEKKFNVTVIDKKKEWADDVEKELDLSGMKDKHIIKYIGSRYGTTEMKKYGDFYTFLSKIGKNKTLLKTFIIKLVYGISSALAYLNKLGLIHTDLKPDNLLIDKTTKEVKICDLGLSNPIGKKIVNIGSWQYMAPEIKESPSAKNKKGVLTPEADMFSMAIIIGSVLEFINNNKQHIYVYKSYVAREPLIRKKIKEMFNPLDGLGFPKELKSLLYSCTDVDPEKRPSPEEMKLFIDNNYEKEIKTPLITESSKKKIKRK